MNTTGSTTTASTSALHHIAHRSRKLPPQRIMDVETGGCPHTAIREDASTSLRTRDGLAEVVAFIEHRGMLAAEG